MHPLYFRSEKGLCYQSHKAGPAKRGQTCRSFVILSSLTYVGIESLWRERGCDVVIPSFPPLGRVIHHVFLSKTKPQSRREHLVQCVAPEVLKEGGSHLIWSSSWLAAHESVPCYRGMKSWRMGHLGVERVEASSPTCQSFTTSPQTGG